LGLVNAEVFDRGFLSAEILCALTRGGSERHFVIPAKSNTRWEVIEGDENGDDFTDSPNIFNRNSRSSANNVGT
jgi:hypothetical protein